MKTQLICGALSLTPSFSWVTAGRREQNRFNGLPYAAVAILAIGSRLLAIAVSGVRALTLRVLRVFAFQFALAVVTLTILPACDRQSTPSTPAPASAPLPSVAIRTTTVKKGEATRSITLPANIEPYQQATLFAKVTGYLKSVNVDKGDTIKEGAVLAEIEVPELLADRARHQAEAEIATLDYRRASEAQKKAPDLVVAQSVDEAKSKADIAKANLERTETLLGFTKIVAPFSGMVTRRNVDPGAFVAAATSTSSAPMFTVMDFSKVRVQAPIPEIEVPNIKTGLTAKVAVDELKESPFAGTVTRFSHALDEATKTMLAEIELPNPKGDLRPGMYASVRIIVERKPDCLIIPVEALLVEKARSSVFTIADSKAKRVTVKTGFNDGGWVEIQDGVKLDDRIVLLGKQPLVDGQAVTSAEGK
jgi:membrane fusion protein (multidrug efflux system)